MIKIYTSANWMSVFDAPSVIIDDDGLIYKEDEYYNLSKTACGRVDTKTGYIYGKGHYSKLTAPVGLIKKGPDCIEIYGDDYASITAAPMYYVHGNAVYTAEGYGKIFRAAEGYIKGDIPAGNLKDSPEAGSSAPAGGRKGAKAGGGWLSILWKIIKTTAVIILLLAISGWLWNEMYFTDNEYRDVFVANVICLLIGLVAAIFKKDKETSSFSVIFWVSTILMGIYIAVGMFRESGFGFKSILFSLLGMGISALYCLTPSILLAVIKGTIELIIGSIRNTKNR